MAGAGYKLFNTGDVLTAAQVNTYLQEQAVMRFANATARTTALSGVLAEGMMSYLDDTNSVEVYNGSAWVSIGSTGDITAVTAGTGISGGGTSGDVTITNSMATAIDAKGDLVVGTAADAFSRLAVGANNTVLTADSSTATGLKWATASAGDTGPSFGAYLASEMTGVTSNTWVKMTFNAEDWDTNSNFSTTNYRFTPTTAGYYQINLQVMTNGNSTSCMIYKNGAALSQGGSEPANEDVLAARIVYCNGSTDYIEAYVYTAGSTVYSGKEITYFSGGMIRSA